MLGWLIQLDPLQVQTVGWRSHTEIGARTAGKGAQYRPRTQATSPHFNQRAGNDANHVIQKAVAFDRDLQTTWIATRATHFGAQNLSHPVRSLIGCTSECGEIVVTH